MARRAAKFHVGMRCILALPGWTGWSILDGEICVVTAPKQRMNVWCSDFDGANRNFKRGQVRYTVDAGLGYEFTVRECHLRPLDGEQISTWANFAKATGYDLRAAIIDAVPVRRTTRKRTKAAA